MTDGFVPEKRQRHYDHLFATRLLFYARGIALMWKILHLKSLCCRTFEADRVLPLLSHCCRTPCWSRSRYSSMWRTRSTSSSTSTAYVALMIRVLMVLMGTLWYVAFVIRVFMVLRKTLCRNCCAFLWQEVLWQEGNPSYVFRSCFSQQSSHNHSQLLLVLA